MKSIGRDNARDAGTAGPDPKTILGLTLLGILIVIIAVINFGLWVSVSITGKPGSATKNPIRNTFEVFTGNLQWTLTATLAVIGLGLVITLLFIYGLRIFYPKKTTARIDHASKHLAAKRDVDSMSKDAATAKAKKWMPEKEAIAHPGLRLGKLPGTKTGLYSTWEDLYLVIFGPRMGKTTSQVIPAIVDAPGVVLTTSNKRDIIDDTIKITAARGEVFVFDPQGIAHGFEQEPWYFDPLDMVRQDPEKMDANAMALADIFKTAEMGAASEGDDAFFSMGGRDIFAHLLLAAAISDRPISDVFLWVSDDNDRTPIEILSENGEWPLVTDALEARYNTVDVTRSGLFAQAQQMAASLGRQAASKWVNPRPNARRFNPDEFVRSKANTLYVLSKEGADNAAALTTALTAAVMNAAERYGEENGGRLPIPLVAPLDEAANVVRWPELPKLYSHYGSRSIILMTILQSYAQGVGVWGEEGMEALWSAAAILLYGGGVRDEKMLSKMEALIGEYEEWVNSVSVSPGQRSVSSSKQEKKILSVSELAALDNNRAVVFAAKRRPLIAEMEPFWTRDYWSAEIRDSLPKEN